MTISVVLSLFLVALCAFLHYETLRLTNEYLAETQFFASRQKVLVAVFSALWSHLTQIALFAIAFYGLRYGLGMEVLQDSHSDSLLTYCYFSTETYTTLGYGDVVPVHEIRLLAGMEALIGLTMISWTASFTYFEMRKYWGRQE